MEYFCNINLFTVTFNQFNASVLNKSINFLQKQNKTKQNKKSYWHQTFSIYGILCVVFVNVVSSVFIWFILFPESLGI